MPRLTCKLTKNSSHKGFFCLKLTVFFPPFFKYHVIFQDQSEDYLDQKLPSRGVLKKRCSENIQQSYSRTPMPKCDFNKVAKSYFGMGVLQQICCIFSEHLFLRTLGLLLLDEA